MKKITIVGGGGTAVALAAYLTLQKQDVKLFDMEAYGAALKEIQEDGEIKMVGHGPTGVIPAPPITFDPKEAFDDAELIFICMVATRHRELCDYIAPYLKDGQTVLVYSGNFCSLWLKKALGGKDVVVGEAMGNFCPCRLVGRSTVNFARHPDELPKPKAVAAFPAVDSPRLVAAFDQVVALGCYPEVPYKNVIEISVNAPNVVVHLGASLLCTSAMEHSLDFRLYRDGLSPSIVEMIKMVEKERAAVCEAMGYKAATASGKMVGLLAFDEKPDPGNAGFRLTTGPSGVTHRYITEDAYSGDSMLLSLGKLCGVETPLIKSFVTIASALNHRDFYAEGNTLENLGLADLDTPEKLNEYLQTGIRPE